MLAGALVTLLSYLLGAVDTVVARCSSPTSFGSSCAGPLEHVEVSALRVLFGVWNSDAVGYTTC